MTFKIVRTEFHQDLNCNIVEYQHPSGFRHFHLDSPYPEMNFNLCLSTPPVDDTGIPHILEHLTLCGSKKYPEKDPFMLMDKRSVSHFMNALTYPDHTSYPFSTTLESDYFNLSDIYLDLVFNPLLRKEDFEQEGWRLEKNDDKWSFKGVVLNEMKGVYSSPSWPRRSAIMRSAIPSNHLGFSSGGHPGAIVHLEFERLKQYHKKYYHPENAVLSTSGNINIQKLHDQIDQTISSFLSSNPQSNKNLSLIAPPKGAIKDVVIEKEQGHDTLLLPGNQSDKRCALLAYVKDAPQTPEQEVYDQIMTHAIFNAPEDENMPLSLLKEKHAINISANYEETVLSQGKSLLCLLTDEIDKSLAPSVLNEVEDAWRLSLDKGISSNQWHSAIENFTSAIKNTITKSPANYVSNIASIAITGRDPMLDTKNLEILESLRQKTPSIDEVKKWSEKFLDNKVLSIITKEDSSYMDNIEKSLDRDLKEMVADGRLPNNKPVDDSPSDGSSLPIIKLHEIIVNPTPLGKVSTSPSTVNLAAHTHIQADITNPAIKVIWSLGDDFSDQDKMLYNVWSSIAKRLGTKDEKSKSQSSREAKSAIKWGWVRNDVHAKNHSSFIAEFIVSAQEDKIPQAIQSMLDRTAGMPLYEEDLYVSTLKSLHSHATKESLDTSLQKSSMGSLAKFNKEFSSSFHDWSYGNENKVAWLEMAIENPKKSYNQLKEVLAKLHACPRHVVSIGKDDLSNQVDIVRSVFAGGPRWDDLPSHRPSTISDFKPVKDKHLPHQAMVNHCFRAFPGPSKFDLQENAKISVLTSLASKHLHKVIREEGGAYGASASSLNGAILLSSFRDPLLSETYKAFDDTSLFLSNLAQKKDEEILLEAKLSIAKGFLAPKDPLNIAEAQLANLMIGKKESEKQKIWQYVQDVSWQDIEDMTKKWFSPDKEVINDIAAVSRSSPIWNQGLKEINIDNMKPLKIAINKTKKPSPRLKVS